MTFNTHKAYAVNNAPMIAYRRHMRAELKLNIRLFILLGDKHNAREAIRDFAFLYG